MEATQDEINSKVHFIVNLFVLQSLSIQTRTGICKTYINFWDIFYLVPRSCKSSLNDMNLIYIALLPIFGYAPKP